MFVLSSLSTESIYYGNINVTFISNLTKDDFTLYLYNQYNI